MNSRKPPRAREPARLLLRPVTRQRDAVHDPAKAVVIVDRVVVRAEVFPERDDVHGRRRAGGLARAFAPLPRMVLAIGRFTDHNRRCTGLARRDLDRLEPSSLILDSRTRGDVMEKTA